MTARGRAHRHGMSQVNGGILDDQTRMGGPVHGPAGRDMIDGTTFRLTRRRQSVRRKSA